MNAIMPPKPLAADDKVVTFSRADWDAYMERIEDAEDAAAVDRFDAEVAAKGLGEVVRLSYTLAESERMTDGTPALCIWRERAGLTQQELAARARVSRSYLAEIETGKKTGTAAALSRLAKVLNVPIDLLIRESAED